MRKALLASAALAFLSGCVSHAYAPGPGLSAADFEPDSARCRLFARGSQSGFSFAAYGSPKFVGASMGGAALGYAIGSAVERNNNFNDCMQARGWRIADGGPATQDGAMTAKLAGGAQLPPIPVSVASQEPPVTHADYHATMVPVTPAPVRREFLAQAMDITPAIAASLNLNSPKGVEVISVDANGAAWASGIRDGDVIRTFNGVPITGISDMRRILSAMAPGETVEATIWRSGSQKSVEVSF